MDHHRICAVEKKKALENQGLLLYWRRRREGAPVSTNKFLVLNNQNPTAFDGAFKHNSGTPEWITSWRTKAWFQSSLAQFWNRLATYLTPIQGCDIE